MKEEHTQFVPECWIGLIKSWLSHTNQAYIHHNTYPYIVIMHVIALIATNSWEKILCIYTYIYINSVSPYQSQ